IELAQVAFPGVRRADVNDGLMNTLGAALGFLAWRLVARRPAYRGLRRSTSTAASSSRWPPEWLRTCLRTTSATAAALAAHAVGGGARPAGAEPRTPVAAASTPSAPNSWRSGLRASTTPSV